MLHGRTAFGGTERKFTRLLLWLGEALPCPARLRAAAAARADRQAAALVAFPESARRRLGLVPRDAEAARRRGIVLEMLRGVPPGVLARRHAVDEAELYVWRDRALAAAEAALISPDDAAKALPRRTRTS
jgi:hypothetical protein